MLRLPAPAMEGPILDALRQQGVVTLGFGQGRIRFVLHSGISDEELDGAIAIIERAVRSVWRDRQAMPVAAAATP